MCAIQHASVACDMCDKWHVLTFISVTQHASHTMCFPFSSFVRPLCYMIHDRCCVTSVMCQMIWDKRRDPNCFEIHIMGQIFCSPDLQAWHDTWYVIFDACMMYATWCVLHDVCQMIGMTHHVSCLTHPWCVPRDVCQMMWQNVCSQFYLCDISCAEFEIAMMHDVSRVWHTPDMVPILCLLDNWMYLLSHNGLI